MASQRPSAGALLAFVLFWGNWFISHDSRTVGGLGILWSVSVEEQFYLVWPLWMKYGGGQIWKVAAAGVLVCSYAVLLWMGAHGFHSDRALHFNTLVGMQFFAAGALLAGCLPRNGMEKPVALRLLLGFVGLCCWIGAYAASIWITPKWWMPVVIYGIVLAGCIALFLGFYGTPGRYLPKSLLWLGKVSYGLYVYHSLVSSFMPHRPAGWVNAAISLSIKFSLTVLIAGLSYHWLERPFLRWKKRFTFVPNGPV